MIYMSDRLVKMLEIHEGVRLRPYHCTEGKLTIGVGRNIEDRGISESEARVLLVNDINEIFTALSKYAWFRKLSDIRKEAIVDMSFMGVGKVLQFKKMIECLESNDFKGAAKEMLNSRWANQVGVRAKQLAIIIESGKAMVV